jgi:hypothetical protein
VYWDNLCAGELHDGMLSGWWRREEWNGRGMWHVRGEEWCGQGFGGETQGKIPPGIPGCRWEGNIKVYLKEWAGRTTGLVCLRTGTGGRLSGCCGHGDVPLGSLKLGEFLDYPRN